jgi:DNA-binding SARP family transcriptional activator
MIRIRLLGKFTVQSDGADVAGFEGARVQELFAYLLLNRGQIHAREALATLFWSESGPDQARKYLRQTFWHLQTALERSLSPVCGLLEVNNDWVRVNLEPATGVWLDVAELESAAIDAHRMTSSNVSSVDLENLQARVGVYGGDLLDGWYQDWCLLERERLQNLYLVLLDKLMRACEVLGYFEDGVALGARMLRVDQAREQTHRRLMRLHYLGGDRTSALRQYERCKAALQRELGVDPGARTQQLYAQIRTDSVVDPSKAASASSTQSTAILTHVLERLVALQSEVAALAHKVEDEVRLGAP